MVERRMSYEDKSEAYWGYLDNQVESHLEYVLTDPEILGRMMVELVQQDSCNKILVKNMIRDMARQEVLENLNII
jgi:hypothetical protein